MVVKGLIKKWVDVDIDWRDAINIIKDHFKIDDDTIIMEPDYCKNITGKRALCKRYDISYHGSPCYEYSNFDNDESRIKAFESIMELTNLLIEKEKHN